MQDSGVDPVPVNIEDTHGEPRTQSVVTWVKSLGNPDHLSQSNDLSLISSSAPILLLLVGSSYHGALCDTRC